MKEELDGDNSEALRYWADVLNVSVDELRFAIGRVGTDIERIRAYLGNSDSWFGHVNSGQEPPG